MFTKVVNKRDESYDYYGGRGSLLGNPYEIGKDGTRDEVCDRYEIWFAFLLKSAVFRRELENLRGKKLGCFCKPQRCHLDTVAKYLNNE